MCFTARISRCGHRTMCVDKRAPDHRDPRPQRDLRLGRQYHRDRRPHRSKMQLRWSAYMYIRVLRLNRPPFARRYPTCVERVAPVRIGLELARVCAGVRAPVDPEAVYSWPKPRLDVGFNGPSRKTGATAGARSCHDAHAPCLYTVPTGVRGVFTMRTWPEISARTHACRTSRTTMPAGHLAVCPETHRPRSPLVSRPRG